MPDSSLRSTGGLVENKKEDEEEEEEEEDEEEDDESVERVSRITMAVLQAR